MPLLPFASGLEKLPNLQRLESWPMETPASLCRFQIAGTWVYVLNLPREPEPWIVSLKAQASAERLSRAQRYHVPKDALRCLAAEALLRHALQELHGLTCSELDFKQGAQGKPELRGPSHIHFNLSHSGAWVMCAMDDHPLGIDVEEIQTRQELPWASILSPQETARLGDMGSEADFYRLWSLKESYLKALGTGFSLDPRQFWVDLEARPIQVFQTLESKKTPEPWQLLELPMPPGTMAALCIQRN